MSDIRVKVIDQNMTITNAPLIASGGVNENSVIFEFDSTWSGYGKTAVFFKDGDEANSYEVILDQNNKAIIPHEVTDEEGKFWFGVVGVKNDVILTSELLWYDIAKGTYEKESRAATPDIYIQMVQLAEAIIEHLNNTPYTEAVDDEEFVLPIHTINDSEVSDESTWSSEKIMNAIYPVGSIYISVNNVNPSTFFGGTWVAWGSGRVPVGVDTSDTDFNSVEKTGGEKKHGLTIAEMPRHRHTIVLEPHSGSKKVVTSNSGDSWLQEYTSETSNTDYTGENATHNNLQPYITCYMWKRTA